MYNPNQQPNKSPYLPSFNVHPVPMGGSPVYGQPQPMMMQPQPVMSPQPMYYYQQQPHPQAMSSMQILQQQVEEDFSIYKYVPYWVGVVPTCLLITIVDTVVRNLFYWIASAFAVTWAIVLSWVARCRCVNAGWSSFLIVLTVITMVLVVIGDVVVWHLLASRKLGLAVTGLVLTGLMIISMMTASIMTFFYK